MPNKRSVGLIYRNVHFFKLTMWLLYRSAYLKKYQAVVDEVEPGSSVIDLCCGECKVAPLLLTKGCKYIGLDINPRFVRWACEKGYDVRLWDARKMEFPEGDVICIQSALYHFIPNDRALVEKMLSRAKRKVIITEPVPDLRFDTKSPLARFVRWMTKVDGQTFGARHTEESLTQLACSFKNVHVKKFQVHRELIFVLTKQ